MGWYILIFLVVCVIVAGGMLIARKNPKIADGVANTVEKGVDLAKEGIDKVQEKMKD